MSRAVVVVGFGFLFGAVVVALGLPRRWWSALGDALFVGAFIWVIVLLVVFIFLATGGAR